MCANDDAHEETLSNKTNVCPNEFTGFSDARLAKSPLLLMFLGAERTTKVSSQEKSKKNSNISLVFPIIVSNPIASRQKNRPQ